MAVEFERPYSHAAHWASRIAYFSFILLLVAWAGHRFGPVTTPGFIAIVFVSVGLSLIALVLALVGISSLWRVGAKGGRASFIALLLTLPVIGPALYTGWRFENRPQFWEVSTDLLDVPAWVLKPVHDQMWLGERGELGPAERQAQFLAYPELIGHRYEGALDRLVLGVRNAAAAAGLDITLEKLPPGLNSQLDAPPVSEDEVDDAVEGEVEIPVPLQRPDPSRVPLEEPVPEIYEAYFQGQAKAMISGLQYDLVIRLREEEETTLADIRVTARYGVADIGGSAGVADRFLRALDAELLGIAGM